jgi:hypothetical protein
VRVTSSKRAASIEVDAALLDPGSVFSSPEEVLGDGTLTREQKVEILRRWEYDAAEVAVAVEEGMPDADDQDLLRRILLALERLAGSRHVGRTGPTKQHGLLASAPD